MLLDAIHIGCDDLKLKAGASGVKYQDIHGSSLGESIALIAEFSEIPKRTAVVCRGIQTGER
jgi:hypothetical protein